MRESAQRASDSASEELKKSKMAVESAENTAKSKEGEIVKLAEDLKAAKDLSEALQKKLVSDDSSVFFFCL